MEYKKIISYILVTILILNIILFATNTYSYIIFWIIIGVIGVISYIFYKE